MLVDSILQLVFSATAAYGLVTGFNGVSMEELQQNYDFVIVGAGSAGCRLADVLSSTGHFEVLLIEAGGTPPPSTEIPLMATLTHNVDDFDWIYRTVPQQNSMLSARNRSRTMNAGKVLGGGSTLNLMAYQRGNREDYDGWEKDFGAEGWNFAEALRIFRQMERLHGADPYDEHYGRRGNLGLTVHRETGPFKRALFKAFQDELGLEYSDPNDGNHWGYYHMISTTEQGRRASSFTAFIEPNLHRPNLHVLIHGQVVKVVFDGDRAIAVDFIKEGQQATVRATREVILSAGALRSPQLLMLSGVGDREHLEEHGIPVVHHLPGVGQNLQDHFGFMGMIAEVHTEEVHDMHDLQGLKQWLLHREGPFTSNSGLQMGAAYVAVGEDPKSPDIELLPFVVKNAIVENDLPAEISDRFYEPLQNRTSIGFVVLVQRPGSRGEVKLESGDNLAPPRIDPKFFSDPADLDKVVKGAQQLLRALRSMQINSPELNISMYEQPFPSCDHLELYSEAYLRCLAVHLSFEIFHPCGSCRMGRASDPMAVVDSRLRVRGVRGLRIVDNSVMPTITVGHLNAPAMMIGTKAGEMILEDHNVQIDRTEADRGGDGRAEEL